MQAGDDRTGDVRNVRKHARANTFCYFADSLKVDDARISGRATDEQLWLVLFGDSLQLVVINRFGFARDTVIKDFVAETGKVQRMPVREMAAVRKVHPQNGIAV